MSDEDFPALGFDPARGSTTAVRSLAQQMIDTGRYAREAYGVLKAVQDKKDVWTGQAAEAFASNLDQLPEHLDKGQESLAKAGKALDEWAGKLEAHQAKATDLERRAKEAIKAAEQADSAAKRADAANTPISYDANDPAAAQQANKQAQTRANAAASAHQDADAAWETVKEIRKQAGSVREWWEEDARTCSKALKDAADDAPKESFFDSLGKMFDDFGGWFKDHVGEIGDIAGIVSAVAGALSFIPVLAPVCGPIAIGAGAIALAAHGADMVMNEKYDDPNAWVGLGGDALGLIPGVGAVSKGVDAGADAMSGAERAVDLASAGDGVKAGARAIGEDVGGSAAKPFQYLAEKGMGGGAVLDPATTSNVAKGFDAGTNVSLQTPNAVGLFDTSDDTAHAKNAAGGASAGVNTANTATDLLANIRG